MWEAEENPRPGNIGAPGGDPGGCQSSHAPMTTWEQLCRFCGLGLVLYEMGATVVVSDVGL